MACNNSLTAGIALDCYNQVGGIEVAYVASFSSSLATITEANGVVSALSLDGVAITDLSTGMQKFECEKQTGTLTETGTFSAEAGTAFYTSVASTVFNKLDSSKQEVLSELGKTRLAVIVKDNNGQFFMVGNEYGATVSNSTGTTGTAWSDKNSLTIEFTGIALEPMYEVSITE